MRKLRIAALVREGLVPPDDAEGYNVEDPPEWKMEFDIIATLGEMYPGRFWAALGSIRSKHWDCTTICHPFEI